MNNSSCYREIQGISLKGGIIFSLFLILSYGCSGLDNSLIYIHPEEPIREGWKDIIEANPIEKDENIKVINIGSTTNLSYHIVQINGKESPHVHNNHDLMVVVKEGKGIIYINDKYFYISEGAILIIPKGIVHHYENRCKCTSVAITIFSPPFDGKDIEKVSK